MRQLLEELFEETPPGLRRLVLVLYGLVGPVFSALLFFQGDAVHRPVPFVAVVALITAGGAWLLLRRHTRAIDWIFPVAISPTVCCGIAYVACGAGGMAYVGVLSAPLAWAAVLFQAPVAAAAWVTATVTCFVALFPRVGAGAAAANTLLYSVITGLVAWVVHGRASQLREARAALERARQRDQALLQAIPDTLARADREGRFLDVQARAGDPLPVPQEELVGRLVDDFVPAEVASDLHKGIERALRTGTPQTIEYAVRYEDAQRFFETRIAGSGADEVLVIRRDVTERRLAEANHRLLATLIDHMQDSVIVTDADFRVRLWSGASAAMYGWSAEEAIGRPVPALLRSELVEGTPEEMFARLRSGQPCRVRFLDERKDGKKIWTYVDIAPLTGATGELTGFLAVSRDISSEVATERALRASEERQRLALASGAHAAWDWDIPADRMIVDEEWYEILGRKRGEIPDTVAGWKSVLHPDDVERAWSLLAACVDGRSDSYEGQYRVRHVSGAWRWIRGRGRVVERDARGRALRIIGTRTDVTEVQELQDRLLAATRLASVGTLAAGVAHEINNPLAWMISNITLALDHVGGAPDGRLSADAREEMRQSLEQASEGAWRIASIVKAMRSLGVHEAPECPLDVDVRAEIANAVQMVRNQVVQRARLAVDVPEVLPLVRARTNELGRVFLNLIVNAAQAIPEGNPSAHTVSIAARAEGGEVVVEVADTGTGIPPDVRSRIFDPFFTTKPVGVGSGLGLPIARSIVDAAGGRIEVESREGQGSTFRVRLPTVVQAPAPLPHPPPVPEPPAPKNGRRRVLVVDDEPRVGRALQLVVGSVHDVTVLSSATDALRRIDAGERWDAILCDLWMPEMDGIAFYQALAERDATWVPKFAFVTGGAFGARALDFLASHAVTTIAKPASAATLLAAVDRLLDASARRRALALA